MAEIETPPPGRQTDTWLEPGKTNVQVVYILYLAGFIIGITPLIGIVLAYVNRGRAEAWIETHYTWAIRTFWIGLLYGLISFVLAFVLVGFLLMLATAVWFILRCIFGLQALTRDEPMKNPQSWVL
ncbi:hypothetical protein [Mesorhizobium sp. Z1-4]|uniref:DUF4870 family protein n=1 Tax=Mesorhizobium sp. Z1-4 TaxID=2448478 RepID=UPI000FDC76B7|nr:hypothetical protein [Mesorhizobium sp. Z1-4]